MPTPNYLYLNLSGTPAAVAVWDWTTDTLVSTLSIGFSSATALYALAISKDGSKVAVRPLAFDGTTDKIAIIDTATQTVTLLTGSGFSGGKSIALSNDGSVAYLDKPTATTATLAVNTSTGAILHSGIASHFNGVGGISTLSQDGSIVFVGNYVTAFNASDMSVAWVDNTLAPVTGSVLGYSCDAPLGFMLDGPANGNAILFRKITPTTGAHVGTTLSTPNASGFVLSADSATAFVGTPNGIEIVDAATLTVLSTITRPTNVVLTPVAMAPDGSKFYCTAGNNPTVFTPPFAVFALWSVSTSAPYTQTQVHDFASRSPQYGVLRPRNAACGVWPSGGGAPAALALFIDPVLCDNRTISLSWSETGASDTSYTLTRNGETIYVGSGTSFTDGGPLGIPAAYAYQVTGSPSGLVSNLISTMTSACADTDCVWTPGAVPSNTWVGGAACSGTTWTPG